MAERFESYLRHATELLRSGDLIRAEGLERLARDTLERLGSPPRLAAKLHALRGERALRQADYPQAEAAFGDAIEALRRAEGEPRELFELLHKLGLARSHQGADERALAAFDEALAVAVSISPAFSPAAYAHIARAESLRADEAAFDAVLAELDGLIGLAAVKAEVRRLAELLRIATMRRAEGLKTVQVSLHLVFQGGAGTGKTTVARLFGRLYKSLGLLATDRVVEVTREDLVSGYVGQTATKTGQAIDGALDGVLFLDEAYGLVRPGSQGDFGPEAVVELLKRMEDDRSRLAVIIAGYPHEMTEFLASNSGFRSRFGETIHFDDYGPAELVLIFETFARDADYALSPAAREELAQVMERLHAARDRYFGNARTARNLFDDVVAHQAERLLAGGGTPDRAALIALIVWLVRRPGRRNGQTIGKQALGIRAARADRSEIGVGVALLREIVAKVVLIGVTSSVISGLLGFLDAGLIGGLVAVAIWYGPAFADEHPAERVPDVGVRAARAEQPDAEAGRAERRDDDRAQYAVEQRRGDSPAMPGERERRMCAHRGHALTVAGAGSAGRFPQAREPRSRVVLAAAGDEHRVDDRVRRVRKGLARLDHPVLQPDLRHGARLDVAPREELRLGLRVVLEDDADLDDHAIPALRIAGGAHGHASSQRAALGDPVCCSE